MYAFSFKQLLVWQHSMELVKEIYRITSQLPSSETFNLVKQIRRSAISIPSNIAEGKTRRTKQEFLQFLRIANASAAELETQLIIAKEIYPHIDFQKAFSFLEQIQRMLAVFMRKTK